MSFKRGLLSVVNLLSNSEKQNQNADLANEVSNLVIARRDLLAGGLVSALTIFSGCNFIYDLVESDLMEKVDRGVERHACTPPVVSQFSNKITPPPKVEFSELLPNYPVSQKVAIIINGDAYEDRHRINVMRAMAILRESFGIHDFHVVADHKILQRDVDRFRSSQADQYPNTAQLVNKFVKGLGSSDYLHLHRYEATPDGVDSMIDSIPQKKDAMVVFYITGHGSKQFDDGCFALRNSCYPLSEMVIKLRKMKTAGMRGVFIMDQCFSGSFPDAIIESGIEGVAMSPGSINKETACQFFSPALFENMAKRLDVNGDGKSEPNEWFQAAMAGYKIQLGTNLDGRFARTKLELSSSNFESVMKTKRLLLVNIRSKACGNDCFEHTEMLNQMMGVMGEQIDIVNLTVDRNREAKTLLKRLGVGRFNSYPITLIRLPDGTFKYAEGPLNLNQMERILHSFGVRRNPKIWGR